MDDDQQNIEKPICDWITRVAEHSFNATIAMGQTAIKSALYLNAGAAIAFLALFTNNIQHFIGMGKSVSNFCQGILFALLLWGMGSILAGISYGLSYFSQSHYTDLTYNIACQLLKQMNEQSVDISQRYDSGRIIRKVCICLVLLSFLAAGAGMIKAYFALLVFFGNC